MSDIKELISALEAKKPRLLLVDDDENILDTVRDILEDEGFEIETAKNGAGAAAVLARTRFNVVVLDFHLPDATGLELARKVRESSPETCVILMTGHATLAMAVEAIKESIYDYLIKPVDPQVLQKTIQKGLETQRLVLENRQLMEDLKALNDRLQRMDGLKSRMISVLSHDIRAPLASIRGYSELLKGGSKGRVSDAQKQVLETTIAEADNINGLIGDLIDLSSIAGENLELELTRASVENLVQKAVARVKHSADQKEVTIGTASVSPLPEVRVDARRMIQVLCNFLRGSIRFTPNKGRVVITIAPKDSTVEVRIANSGHGLDRETLEQVRQLVSGKGPVQTAAVDSLGVSLGIAREITEAHGGTAGLESEGKEMGLVLWVRIPQARGEA